MMCGGNVLCSAYPGGAGIGNAADEGRTDSVKMVNKQKKPRANHHHA